MEPLQIIQTPWILVETPWHQRKGKTGLVKAEDYRYHNSCQPIFQYACGLHFFLGIIISTVHQKIKLNYIDTT